MSKYILWKWVYNDRGEMERMYWNGLGWSSRGRAKKLSQGDAERKQGMMSGSMVRKL